MKRFLQGLGAGILATTLVFTVSYYAVGNKKMSDSEIVSRAKQLGMVQPTEAPIFNIDNVDNSDSTEDGNNTENIMQDGSQTEQQNDLSGNENTTDESVMTENMPEIPQDNNQSEDGTVQLTINKGDGATAVSWRLQQLGVIGDAVEFDQYLRNNSLSHSIQVGTFDVRAGMSYEEITSIISSAR